MTTREQEETEHYETHRNYFREVLRTIHSIMLTNYGMRQISVRPIGSGGSRLSIPIKIVGVNDKGGNVRFFGKILGSNDLMTARAIQVVKNIYLEMNSKDPMFGFAKSSEEMARHQYETMSAIYALGLPTARPFGYHNINDILWLLVTEFLDARPINSAEEVTSEVMDTVFGYLKRMHKANIYHGDIKPDNIMLGDKVYILDVGRYLEEASTHHKQAYDLASQIASFTGYQPPEEIVKIARRHYSQSDIKAAAEYIELIQRRPDFALTDEKKDKLLRLMRS